MAEGRMIVAGFRDGVDGEWSITRAEHSMDGNGYATTVEAEQPIDEGTPAIDDAVDSV